MADGYVLEKFVARMLVRGAMAMLVIALAAYPLDWAIWRVRVAMGGGMGSVTVTRFTVAELKGSKEEYYMDGTTTVDCSKSLFPEAGSGACWWLDRHKEIVVKY